MKKRVYKKKTDTTNEYEKTHVNILNTPYLVIVESPSKCAKIESFLGFQYKCIASKGHIRELDKVGAEHVPSFKIIEEKAGHVKWMQQIVSQFDHKNIYLGTDDDREGEAIAWHICEVCKLSPEHTKRILFHEVTATALKHAVANPLFIRMNIVRAQQTRQIIDRMIGFRISPVLSRLVSHTQTNFLSAGRCQTPTLKLIYDRHMENDKKGSDDNKVEYKIIGNFFAHPSILQATLNISCDQVKYFMTASKDHEHRLNIKEKKRKTKPPPTPFKTSHLLQTANSLLHMSPKYVMDACQTLYQDGKITYMRTESMTYAKGFLDQCRSYIESNYGATSISERLSSLENTDNNNPHEAIRVTHLATTQTDYKDKKINDLYRLIRNRTLESCMADYHFEQYNIEVTTPLPSMMYSSSVEVPLFLGWKRVSTTPEEMIETQTKLSNDILYWKLFQNKKIPYTKIEAVLHMMECDKYYNEASLIQKLETLGIGRPSTFSILTETIQERKYVQRQDIEGKEFVGEEYTLVFGLVEVKSVKKTFGASKNKLVIQELGIQVIHKLQEFEALFEYSYTSKMEKELDQIIENDALWKSVCESCDEMISSCLAPLQTKIKKKYVIDESHTIVFGKFGVVVQHQEEEDGIKSYKTIKKNVELDFEKMENHEYTLEDILEIKNDCLGKFENEEVMLKVGKYGPYVTYGDKSMSIKSLITKSCPIDKITMADIEKFLTMKTSSAEKVSSVLRELSETASVRRGKFGNYIYYKTDTMKKPEFINLSNCPWNVLEDDAEKICKWISSAQRTK